MAKLSEVLEKVKYYSEKFRNPELQDFCISGLYDLFPDEDTTHKTESKWPDTWPNIGKAVVYLFLDNRLEVAYIGKSKNFGNRLSSYFQYDLNNKCRLKNNWKTKPRFVLTIAVPDTSKFEISSLEEFLISQINPTDNTLGKV